MFNRQAIITILAATALISGDAFALAYEIVPRRADGALGILLVLISVVAVAGLLKRASLIPAKTAVKAGQSIKNRRFLLYVGLFSVAFALVKVINVTRSGPLFLRIAAFGISVTFLGLIITGVYIGEVGSQ